MTNEHHADNPVITGHVLLFDGCTIAIDDLLAFVVQGCAQGSGLSRFLRMAVSEQERVAHSHEQATPER